MELEDKRKLFVEKHTIYVLEKEKQEKIILQQKLQNLRDSNIIKEFIFENIEFIFENGIPNKEYMVTGEELTNKFNDWFLKKNKNGLDIKNFNLYLEFQDVKYLGPANENKWYGITFKN